MVLIVVAALCALLCVVALAVHREARRACARAQTRAARRQAEWLAWGGIRLASALLENDPTPGFDHPGELWAQPLPEQSIGPGTVRVRLDDLQSRLDLNNLDATPPDPARPWDDVLRDLFRITGLDQGATAVSALRDWTDEDGTGNAESALYLRRTPPHRAKNARLDSLSELRLIAGWPAAFWEEPETVTAAARAPAPARFVTVIPRRAAGGGWTRVNLNTAPVPVLWAVLGYTRQGSAEAIARLRDAVPFPDLRLAEQFIPQDVVESVRPWLDVRSDFFQVRVRSRVADQEVLWTAELSRAGDSNQLALRMVSEGCAATTAGAAPDAAAQESQTTP